MKYTAYYRVATEMDKNCYIINSTVLQFRDTYVNKRPLIAIQGWLKLQTTHLVVKLHLKSWLQQHVQVVATPSLLHFNLYETR
jgi:hypothetical protein